MNETSENLNAALVALEAVRELHAPDYDRLDGPACRECSTDREPRPWPCATREAVSVLTDCATEDSTEGTGR